MACMLVVPPQGMVVRHAIDDAVPDDGRAQRRHHQALQVVVAQPGGQHAPVLGLGKRRAYAQAHGFQAITVPIKLRQVFAKGLAHAVQAVRAHRVARIDHLVLPVKPGDMVGAGEHDALDALLARRLVQVIDTDDIGGQDRLPGLFGGDAAQVHDHVHLLRHLLHGKLVGQIGDDDLLAGQALAQALAVAQAQMLAIGFQPRAQFAAQATGGPGQENAFESEGAGMKWHVGSVRVEAAHDSRRSVALRLGADQRW